MASKDNVLGVIAAISLGFIGGIALSKLLLYLLGSNCPVCGVRLSYGDDPCPKCKSRLQWNKK